MKILKFLLVITLLLAQPVSVSARIRLFQQGPTFNLGQRIASQFYQGKDSYKDNFAVYSDNGIIFAEDAFPSDDNLPAVAGESIDPSLSYQFAYTELPLHKNDYYWGKYLNAAAGVRELNRMPTLAPGNRIRVIADGYLSLNPRNGYVRPQNGYFFGSGLCWSTSALGQMMDNANNQFKERYGIPMFVFARGDRAPHADWSHTYKDSNRGYGYTVIKISSGGGQDYGFTLNPAIKNIKELEGLKIRIVLTYRNDHPSAYKGESIGAYIMANKDIRLISYTDPQEMIEEYKQSMLEHIRSL